MWKGDVCFIMSVEVHQTKGRMAHRGIGRGLFDDGLMGLHSNVGDRPVTAPAGGHVEVTLQLWKFSI